MRVVSLLPSATELLFAVGAGDEVVGVTHECDYPSRARELPALTRDAVVESGMTSLEVDRHIRAAVHAGSSIYALDETLLSGLEPDLIVTQELCAVCAVSYEEVSRAARRLRGGVPVLSLEPHGLHDILATVAAVGEATGHGAEAGCLAAAMRERVEAVRRAPGLRPAPRVACLEWTDPVMAAGHWVPEMVAVAGGVDVLGSPGERSVEVGWSAVREAGPDVMVLMPCGYGVERTLEAAADIVGRPGFERLPCAASGRVGAVDGAGRFNRPGPRIVDGLEILAAVLRARPGEPLPEGAAWVPLEGR